MPNPPSPIAPNPPHRLEASLLGRLALQYNGHPLPESAFRRRKSVVLLLRLLVTPDHRLPVDTVLELLWPEQDPQGGAVNLRAVLSDIRAALADRTAPHLVVRLDASLALHPDLDLVLDADQFEAAATSGLDGGDPAAMHRALTLYTGPLLPSMPYEDWVQERSAVLARLYRQVLLTLAADGVIATEERLRILLAADPIDEIVAQALMRLLGAHGQRAEALRVYHALVSALEKELGVPPSPETDALHSALLEPPAPLPRDRPVTPASPPPARPRHNLPAALSSFVGRSWERAELRQLLDRTRLLTLVGPGGAGKTRLSLAVAEERLNAFPDGVWLVELAPVGAGAVPTQAVAGALGLREEAGRPLIDTIVAHLLTKTALLLLDNCEHLLAACAELVDGLLRACPRLRILATSRERLGLTGESVWRVPPLSLPPQDAPQLAQLVQAEAVQLFVERVRSVRPGFALTAETAQAVIQICRQLDGIPLALELAAARAGVLAMEQIAGRLADRFRLLTGGSRVALPRQQTLRASIDWSYDLLAEAERALLNRLAVFAGGWTLDAAEAVCAGTGIMAEEVLDLLDGLATRSLVQVEGAEGGVARYRLLETMRQYGWERLGERAESAAVRDRHLRWCLALAEEAEPALIGSDRAVWLVRLEREHPNLRAALSWAVDAAEPTVGQSVAGALWRFWHFHSHLTEGRHYLRIVLTMPCSHETPDAVRAKALFGASVLAMEQGDPGAASPLLEEALQLYRADHDRIGMGATLNVLALAARMGSDYPRAVALHQESLALARAMDNRRGMASNLSNLGVIARDSGDYTRAADLYAEALALFRHLRDSWGIALLLTNLGEVTRFQGNEAAAAAFFREGLPLHQQMGHKQGVAECLEGLAFVAGAYGGSAAAVQLLGAADAIRQAIGYPLAPMDLARRQRELDTLRLSLDAGDTATGRPGSPFDHAWAAGQAMPLEQAIALSLSDLRSPAEQPVR